MLENRRHVNERRENEQNENESESSIITISDVIVGNDVLLNAGIIANTDNINENNIMSVDGDDRENANHTPGVNRDLEPYYDYDRDVVFNRVAGEVIINAENVNEYIEFEIDISDDDATEIFDFDEYQQQAALVAYSDSDNESEDSYFSKTDNTTVESNEKPECPICKNDLMNRQPRFIDTCGHMACLPCLKQLFKMSRDKWKCMLCRTAIPSKRNCKK